MIMRVAQLVKEGIGMANHNSKHAVLLLPVFMATILPLVTPLTAQPTMYERLDEVVRAEATYDLFSGTVLLVKDGEIIYSGGFGEANKEYHITNGPETKFNISSIQKTFIATLVMQLTKRTYSTSTVL